MQRNFKFDLKTICACLSEECDFKIIGLQCLSDFHADKWILLAQYEDCYIIQSYCDKQLIRHQYALDYAETLGKFQEVINEYEPVKTSADIEFEALAEMAEMEAQDFFADINAYFDQLDREPYEDIENNYKEDYPVF